METKDAVINNALKKGWLVCIKGAYRWTNKAERHFNPEPQKTKPVKQRGNGYERAKERLQEFVKKAEVPFRLKLDDGRDYTVSAISQSAVMIFQKIEHNPNIDMEKFIAATKEYYNTPGARVILRNYFEQDVWKGAYEDYLASGSKPKRRGSNKKML